MVRSKVSDPIGISTWEEADDLLGQIAERQREVERIRLDLDTRIATMKNNAQIAAKEHEAFIRAGEKRLAMFARLHEADFGRNRSRRLTHGTVGWRASTRVKFLLGETDVISRLMRLGHTECVTVKAPTVDKNAVRRLSTEDLEAAGITLDTKDGFYWESDEAELPDVEAVKA